MEKIDKIRHPLLSSWSQGLNTRASPPEHEGHTWKEDTPSYSVVNKWAAEFKRGRESLEDDPVQEDCTMLDFVHFFHFQGLEG